MEKQALAGEYQQRLELMRDQDEKMRQHKASQMMEYRNFINFQKANHSANPIIKLNNPSAGAINAGPNLGLGSPGYGLISKY